MSAPRLGDAELRRLADAIEINEIALGGAIGEFEARLAEQAGTSGAVALSSGTAAIHLALDMLGVGSGDRVFCSSLSFIASAAPIRQLGGEPVFIDCEPESWNMSPGALAGAFAAAERSGGAPKAVVVAEVYGQSADFDRIGKICAGHGVPVVEDAAEAIGATNGNRTCGGLGALGVYSFNGNKIVTTGGGGALLADDDALLARARHVAAQARDPGLHYEHSRLGYNFRLSNLAASIGLAQLDRLEERIAARQAVFRRYAAALGEIEGVGLMPEAGFGRHTRWLSVVTVQPHGDRPSPTAICRALDAAGIEARPVWKPLHRQPVFAGSEYFSHADGDSVSDTVFATGICLPSGPDVTEAVQDRVIEEFRIALEGRRERTAS